MGSILNQRCNCPDLYVIYVHISSPLTQQQYTVYTKIISDTVEPKHLGKFLSKRNGIGHDALTITCTLFPKTHNTQYTCMYFIIKPC